MAFALIQNGAVDKYLQTTGKTPRAFNDALFRGDPGACSIFAAEVVYGAIHDLIRTVEAYSTPTSKQNAK